MCVYIYIYIYIHTHINMLFYATMCDAMRLWVTV